MRLCLPVVVWSSLAVAHHTAPLASPTNRRAAAAANTAGMQHYRSGEFSLAAEQFRAALKADESYVNAHYNLACVASRMGDAATAISELGWLSAQSDSASRAKLAKAKSDPDLDYVSAFPKAREKLALPPFQKMRPSLWLSERSGVWSAGAGGSGSGCEERSYTLAFHDEGEVTLRVHERCSGKASDSELQGRWSLTPVAVVIPEWKAWPKEATLEFVDCDRTSSSSDAPGSCFMLVSGKAELGAFHRGLPFPPAPQGAAH
jgi:hypothetical protein